MAKASTVVRVTADIKDAQNGFKKLSNTVNDFKQKNLSLNGIMTQAAGTLGKLGVAFGAAEVASKTFNAMMDNSQAFGDKVRNSMSALNTTLGTLAGNLASMDFSNMTDGLGEMYRKAVKAANAMDALFNKNISADMVAAREMSEFQKNMTLVRDKSFSVEERKRFLSNAEANASNIQKADSAKIAASWDVVLANISQKSGISVENIPRDIIRAAYEDITKNPEKIDSVKAIMRTQPTDRNTNTFVSPTTGVIFGTGPSEQYKMDMTAWRKKNTEALIYNAVNEKMSDAEFKFNANLIMGSDSLEKSREETKRQLLEGRNLLSSGSASSAKPVKGSLDITEFDFLPPASEVNATTQSMASLNVEMQRYKELASTTTNPQQAMIAERGIKLTQARIDAQPIALKAGISVDEAVLQQNLEETREKLQAQIQPLEIDVTVSDKLPKSGKQTAESWQAAYTSVSNVAGALQMIDNRGVNIAGMIAEAVANVALGFAQASASHATGAAGVWGWIAAATAGLATMTATIIGIKQATSGSFASGGIVPGVYNGGMDNTYIYASPGEVILNRAQQQNLLGQLDGPESRYGGEAYVRGETLYMALNNYKKRTGKK